MPSENLRRHSRRTKTIPALLTFPWGGLPGRIENIGEGGVFFVTDTMEGTVAVGDSLTVSFAADSQDRREIPGEILRVERYFHEGELFRSFAVRFTPTDPVADDPS